MSEENDEAEALAVLRKLVIARDELASRLAEMLKQAQARAWQIDDEDWLAIDALTRKLKQLNQQIGDARRLGLDSGPSSTAN